MSTRMERMESGASKRARQRAHMEVRIRDGLNNAIAVHNSAVILKGKGQMCRRVDQVFVSSECVTVIGDKVAADLAAKLFKQSGLRDVTVMQGVGDQWTATGLV